MLVNKPEPNIKHYSQKLKVFITGAAGFIASHLIDRLERDGHEVWGCDISFSNNSRIRRIDVADFGGMERLIQFINPHFVVHLANFGNRYPDHFSYQKLWETNVIGTEHILELQKRYGFDLIYTSSSEVYGTEAPSPVYENYEGNWWYNDYAASKWVSEKLITRQCVERPDLRAVILRLFGVYGPNQPHTKDNSVVAQFIDKIGNGEPVEIHGCSRCFLYVDDAVEAIVRSFDLTAEQGELKPMNIGSQESVSIRKLAEKIAVLSEKMVVETEREKVLVGVKDKIPEIGLAKAEMGWSPKITLEEGLKRTMYPVPQMSRPTRAFGVFVSVDGENTKPRRLSCAERCSDEELVVE